MTRVGVRAALRAAVVLAIAALAPPAHAASYTLDFDGATPGSIFSAGPGGLTFDDSPVVALAGSRAFSPPNILRRQGNCQGGNCASGDHRLVMNFANPARTVSLRAGVPLTENPSCEANACPVARMVGFNAANQVVAVSSEELVDEGDMRLNQPLSMSAAGHLITRAVFAVGADPRTGAVRSAQHTAQIDNLFYDVAETGDPPPPPPPDPPTIEISDPGGNDTFASTDVSVRGRVFAPGGIAEVCVAANVPAAFPARCGQRFDVAADGEFAAGFVPGMRPGDNVIRVWVRDRLNREATSAVNVVVAAGEVDYAIRTIEVNQAVQTKTLPAADEQIEVPAIGRVPGDTYAGVPLAQVKRTIVRVFGEARGASRGVRNVPAVLRAYVRAGGQLRELPYSPLRPTASAAEVAPEADIPRLRAGGVDDWTFLLPTRWTNQREEVTLVAEIAPGSITSPATDCCPANNHFGLKGLVFRPVRAVTVYPVALPYRRTEGTPPVTRTFMPAGPLERYYEDFKKVWPGQVFIAPARPPIDVTDLWSSEDPAAAWNTRLMDTFRDARLFGKVSGLVDAAVGGAGPGPTSATGSPRLSLDLVAHEVGHSIGLAHAHNGGNGGCPEEPAARGPASGIGIDPELGSGGRGRFRMIATEEPGVFDGPGQGPSAIYDYMSYCSDQIANRSWVTPAYWSNQVAALRPGGSLIVDYSPGCCFLGGTTDPMRRMPRVAVREAQAAQPTLAVTATVGPGEDAILNVQERTGVPSATAPGSDVEIVVRNSEGAEVSRTPVAATPLEARPLAGERDRHGRVIDAVVPGAGAASVEVLVGGAVVATRRASANPPRVSLQAPLDRGSIGSGGRLTVRWTASDADGDALVSTVQFSGDGGRRWKTLGVAPAGGESLSVARSELPRSSRGLLRVRTGDGFHAAEASVTRLRTAGARPKAAIVSPRGGTRVLGDTTVTLEGQAFDDDGRPIASERLEWRSGARRLGRGTRIDVRAHRLSRSVTLRATDRAGRVGSHTIRLRVERVAPIFTSLTARRLRSGPNAIRLRAAASLPSSLTVSGAGLRTTRTRIDTKTRTVTLRRSGRARAVYDLRLLLTAEGRRATRTIRVR
jgi:hypothetical protein